MAKVTIVHNNIDEALSELEKKKRKILEILGLKAEKYAKARCPVGTPESTGIPGYMGGTLRNSITHKVELEASAVHIGTNVEYAPYVEMGTVKMSARPYLKPAVEDHMDEYKKIIETELKT